MTTFTAIVERDADTGFYVGWVPGLAGAHSQGATIEELRGNLQEVLELLVEDGEVRLTSEFVKTETLHVG